MSETIDSLALEIAALKARVAALETGATTRVAQQSADEKKVADDYDLDSEWGDPKIRFGLKEKYWKEQPDPFIGFKYSECTPEYLDATAKYLDACAYMARKNADETKAGYKARDASRARGWAARIRKNGAPFATRAESEADADLDFP